MRYAQKRSAICELFFTSKFGTLQVRENEISLRKMVRW